MLKHRIFNAIINHLITHLFINTTTFIIYQYNNTHLPITINNFLQIPNQTFVPAIVWLYQRDSQHHLKNSSYIRGPIVDKSLQNATSNRSNDARSSGSFLRLPLKIFARIGFTRVTRTLEKLRKTFPRASSVGDRARLPWAVRMAHQISCCKIKTHQWLLQRVWPPSSKCRPW
jgi:hypothetical protein